MNESHITARDLKGETNQLEQSIKQLVNDFYHKTSFCPLIKIESWFTNNSESNKMNILTRTDVTITLKDVK